MRPLVGASRTATVGEVRRSIERVVQADRVKPDPFLAFLVFLVASPASLALVECRDRR